MSKSFCLKCFALLLALCAFGLPIVTAWKAVAFFVFVVMLVYADGLRMFSGKKRILLFVVILALLGIRYWLPVVAIEEGHNNYFPPETPTNKTYSELPGHVKETLHASFLKYYPMKVWCSADNGTCWRYGKNNLNQNSYAFSADGFWQRPKYSRVVHYIDFHSMQTFRGGFFNDRSKNWYWGKALDLQRGSMPFFVAYEIPGSLVNSKIRWRGLLFWPEADGVLRGTFSDNMHKRVISEQDVGKKIIGISFPGHMDLRVKLVLSDIAQMWNILADVITILVLLCLLFFFRVQYKASLFFLWWVLLGTVVVSVLHDHLMHLLGYFNIMSGGDDGLGYQGMAREMLRNLHDGHVVQALQGTSPVFYFMPGMRYFLVLSKLLFGDTDLGLLLAIFTFFGVLGEIFRYLLRSVWLALFVFLIFVGQYLTKELIGLACAGMSEAVACPLFLLGGLLLCKSFRKENMRSMACWASFCFGLSVMLRPNFAIAAVVGLSYAAYPLLRKGALWKAFRRYYGFLVVLLIPLHNVIFGHRFVLLTSSAFIEANYKLSVSTYYQAMVYAFTRAPQYADAYHGIGLHLAQWGAPLPFFCLLAGILLVAIGVFTKETRLRLWAVMAMAAHAPLFFWTAADRRYTCLAWLLTAIVVIMWCLRFSLSIWRTVWDKK